MVESQTWDVSPESPEGESALSLVTEAAAAAGLRVAGVETLRPRDPRKRGRSAHRLDLVGGGHVKARVLESANAVRELIRLRRGLEPAFAPTLGGHGSVVLEAWVEGVPLSAREVDRRLEEAALLMARLHARARREPPNSVATLHWRTRADADLRELAESASLTSQEIAALHEVIVRHDPGRAPLVLAHRDFCPENMLIDGEGALRVIDNELFEPAPPGFDVGRVLYRWPMSLAQQARFLAAYESVCALEREPLVFWVAASVLLSARVRHGQAPDRSAVPLAAARALAADPQRLLAGTPVR